MLEGVLEVPGAAASLRKGLDPLRAGGRVIDRPEHEVEPPEDLVGRHLRKTLAQRRHERPAGHIEILGDQLIEQRRVLRSEDGAEAAETLPRLLPYYAGVGFAYPKFELAGSRMTSAPFP